MTLIGKVVKSLSSVFKNSSVLSLSRPGAEAYTLREHTEMLEETGLHGVAAHTLPVLEMIVGASL